MSRPAEPPSRHVTCRHESPSGLVGSAVLVLLGAAAPSAVGAALVLVVAALLAQLRNIPFGELKIDCGFVHGAARDATAHATVEASLGMARQLKLRSVAEDVEDRDDWNQMRRMGCDYAQGYFVARPMSADVFDKWHVDWKVNGQQTLQ